MSGLRKQLLLGAGYPMKGTTSDQRYRKRMRTINTTDRWEALTTLDINPECDPDLLCDLNSTPWFARTASEGIVREMESNYWDEIHAYEVLEHLGRQGDAHSFFAHFSEIWRLLKPGGHLLASVPSKRSGFFWGDPSHSRAIVEESLIFLDQREYIAQCDGLQPTGMSDYRNIYQADFQLIDRADTNVSFHFILKTVKPSRWKART